MLFWGVDHLTSLREHLDREAVRENEARKFNREFGEMMKARREAVGVPMRQMSRFMGFSHVQMMFLERGEANWTVEDAEKYLGILNNYARDVATA